MGHFGSFGHFVTSCIQVQDGQDEAMWEEVVGENLSLLVKTLKCFEKVVHGCFGKVASVNYQELIDDFENAWFEIFMEFDLHFTNKAHILISHVPQVIKRTGKG